MRSATQAAWHSFDDDGSEYLALFNLSDTQRTIAAEGFSRPPAHYCELWGRDTLLRSSTSAGIPAHGTVLIRAEF